jgi:uncharacterized membrane protein YccC
MLVVYGKRGVVTSIGCLLLSLIAMYAAGQGMPVTELLLAMTAGMGIYILINVVLAFLLQRWEQAHSLGMALYATATYLKCRSRLLNPRIPLEDAARATISAQAVMADMHQSARDMIFSRSQPDTNEASPRYHELARVLYHMVSLHDMLLGSYPDYKQLRQVLGQHEVLNLSARILSTLAEQTDWIALAVTRNQSAREHRSVTGDLIELEKAITSLESDETLQNHEQLIPVLRQLQHRLVTAQTTIKEMLKATQLSTNDSLACAPALPPFVRHMLSRQSYSPKLLLENFRLDSPPFRFALRVSIAVLIGLVITMAFPVLGAHAYWIVLTIIIIMKPAFALTKQRNIERLSGTLIGCLMALAVCTLTNSHTVYALVAGLSLFLIPAFILFNYRIAVIFITLLVLLSLQLVLPDSTNLIAERGLDTLIGSIIALACSRILPWWEAKSMPNLAQALAKSQAALLAAGIEQIQCGSVASPVDQWSLAKRDALLAYSNYANALYRMMREPKSQQKHAEIYNDLLLATHVLATEISTVVYLDQRGGSRLTPTGLDALKVMSKALQTHAFDHAESELGMQWPAQLPSAYVQPMQQLQAALKRTITDLKLLDGRPMSAQ